ncbi:tripartite tricarboxylate transporter substrate binding protein [Sediminicoccus sp. KRV36]|uniref:Bug family tripartite tricarboxylate transporter substrate binding protein n=1 Tax=Sediminicoccus sp. KRV36 TaxID=3133721 RepID=UPI00200C61F6|nr:tripartite tricarboxylate transporter substrate binding protein [Sediminicoccus rosea]UPY38101.1 tripartite tricarboxylate transporter substrate binding protein [Sediminicoccus rosea]
MTRRRTLILAGLAAPGLARAQQDWPARPIRIVLPFAAGGSSDIAARLIAPRLGAALGQQIVIENRGGGGGNIAAELVARAAPDGYTIFQGNIGVLAINPTLYRSLPFDAEQSFQPIAHINSVANILCVPADRPWRSVAELRAAMLAAPERVRAGNSGPGSIGHLAVVQFDHLAGTRSVHVPYRGGGPMSTDLIAGHLDYAFATAPTVLSALEAGRVRALAIGTATRSTLLPNLPTVAEAGLTGFEVSNWDAWLFPRGTPPAITERMAAALRPLLADPELRAEFTRRGMETMPVSGPAELAASIRAETLRWAPMVRASGATPDG